MTYMLRYDIYVDQYMLIVYTYVV